MAVYVFRVLLYINSHITGPVVNTHQAPNVSKKKDCQLAGNLRNFDIKHNYNAIIKSNCQNYRQTPADVQ